MSETVSSWRERLTARGGLVSREDLRAVLALLWPGGRHREQGGPVQPAGDAEPVGGKPLDALPPTGGQGAGAWHEVKTIHGREYVYRRWREGEQKRSEYVGKAGGA